MKAIKTWYRALAFACVFGISSAEANLVANGGFETGDFSGWALSGNIDPGSYGVNTAAAHSGTYGADFQALDSQTFLSQQISTAVGASYTLDFWLQNVGADPNNLFTVYWDNNQIYGLTNGNPSAWIEYTFSGLTATAASTELEFGFEQNLGAWYFDDVSVNATAVPEPSSWYAGACATLALVATFICPRRKTGPHGPKPRSAQET